MFINIFLGCLARLMNKIEGGNFSKVTVDDIPFVFILFPAVICCHANHFTKYTTEQNIPLYNYASVVCSLLDLHFPFLM